VNTVKAAYASVTRQPGGRIVLVSSQAGQVGIFGYTAYSSSKFALRGLAEALQMEVRTRALDPSPSSSLSDFFSPRFLVRFVIRVS
jgi:NAD(P)-dependent dehydrogenase (short-subunit alcohol dehydrogenase family)